MPPDRSFPVLTTTTRCSLISTSSCCLYTNSSPLTLVHHVSLGFTSRISTYCIIRTMTPGPSMSSLVLSQRWRSWSRAGNCSGRPRAKSRSLPSTSSERSESATIRNLSTVKYSTTCLHSMPYARSRLPAQRSTRSPPSTSIALSPMTSVYTSSFSCSVRSHAASVWRARARPQVDTPETHPVRRPDAER